MSRNYAFIATLIIVALTCIVVVHGREGSFGRRRQVTPRPVRSPTTVTSTSRKTALDDSYSPMMAYTEETKRPPRSLYECQWDVEDFHSGGNYDSEVQDVINNAIIYANALTPQNNSLWVFDVDETTLSGYTEMLSIGFGYVSKLNHEWVLSSSAPAITQTLNFYKQLVTQGFKIAFLTGRHDDEHDATQQNLINVGYTKFDTLITRVPSEYNLTATVYKSNRRTQLSTTDGYNIVGCVGDQWSDLHGPYTGFKVKIPNYIYYLP